MPTTLSTTISKIQLVPNPINASLIKEFDDYMVSNRASERHQNNSLKMGSVCQFFGANRTFYDLERPEQIISFLDTKIKSGSRRGTIISCTSNSHLLPESSWERPPAARIKKKKTRRLSPYSETEIWDREELYHYQIRTGDSTQHKNGWRPDSAHLFFSLCSRLAEQAPIQEYCGDKTHLQYAQRGSIKT